MRLESYAMGKWYKSEGKAQDLFNAATGEKVAEISSEGLDFKGMLEYARNVGGPNLREMTFHERAAVLKNTAKYLLERKEELYKLSLFTGATRTDSWIDIDGGIGTFFTYSGKGRRELPNEKFLLEGEPEIISKNGTFVGRHILVPLQGAAVHINAYNFPCWGMLEKIAPTLLAGMPSIVKPAPEGMFLAEKVVCMIIESGFFPEGSLQLISGDPGDLLDHLTCQDVVAFTGSAQTGRKLRTLPSIVNNSVRFNMETDSINCSILGPDVTLEMPEFELFIKEVVREMTVKAGQKCTAIRRTLVPLNKVADVVKALKKKLADVKIGSPENEEVKMGPLVSRSQLKKVKEKVMELSKVTEIVYGYSEDFKLVGTADKEKGAFLDPVLLYCNDPEGCSEPHEVEAFGPVNTVMPYVSLHDAIKISNMGHGSLVASVFTADDNIAKELTFGLAPFHGRIMVVNRNSAKESTGHGSPMPQLVHGGPGRAGGGEELGGILGVKHYMQRVALQGSPTTLTNITNVWMEGAAETMDRVHPFQKYFEELKIGETLTTHRRTITEADIVNFAGVSGDFFYVHMDEVAANESYFQKRVVHGYFIIAAAAGLFVHPAPGPVIANYGLENLRFIKPVAAGDTIYVKLTCKRKSEKEIKEDETPAGIVEWHVEVLNQANDKVAVYDILTLVKMMEKKD
ncbi:MAG: phenylacetic acid degradation bifunctional protein PaaZ [Ignavibacteria bacterium]|jgi:oxepin-CoA hydrolase/3-oxo-5,6-dehydrosuberyl-CoA semialdehyde dehydrogenase|nr:phenylacetic acid degradation bifunctional protein PaaZ [Ignavibacteria bacterium]MCU7500371.1 phenylacetic acid degradation bifunctional protein PaaZ [Ignavibacteria bacterium]MCU7513511.1 phenylacetic acid degradation bifunctional protein PaaZ [Ignavibacteria bacterium]MCU7520157.1 phenylacetic acid degradation bifunctional protein PaaZ [Ignavibacteria bacterium]MCU7526067.1 phenylacetic acid degradation bifunctional protein PaaZ [Ignavibacteria bacterium]